MTLFETINLINQVAQSQPNINSIVKTGDVFDLNKDNFKQEYSAFCCQQNQHLQNGDFITYNFTLFYVDRLTDDSRNKIEIQSTGIITLGNIIRILQEQDLIFSNIDSITYQPFTQRFEAECAGVYCNIGIVSPVDVCVDSPIETTADLDITSIVGKSESWKPRITIYQLNGLLVNPNNARSCVQRFDLTTIPNIQRYNKIRVTVTDGFDYVFGIGLNVTSFVRVTGIDTYDSLFGWVSNNQIAEIDLNSERTIINLNLRFDNNTSIFPEDATLEDYVKIELIS